MGTLAFFIGIAVGAVTRFWPRQRAIIPRPTVDAARRENRIVERITEVVVVGLAGYLAATYIADVNALAALTAIGLVLLMWQLENDARETRERLEAINDQLETLTANVRSNLPT